jgi:DNA-binding NtrC family response regulator
MTNPRGRILVVDDDGAVRTSLEGVLSTDFDVQTVTGVDAAEVLLKSDQLDVVLTDYDMPGRNGVELVRLAAQVCPSVMVLLVTGHHEVPELKSIEDAETVVRVLQKPYDPKRLLAWVANAVTLSRLRRATTELRKVTPGRQ